MSEFTPKERLRFRKLLEVANSTTFPGEREAALGAATRLAEAHGMDLREAAGLSELDERPRRPAFRSDFGARNGVPPGDVAAMRAAFHARVYAKTRAAHTRDPNTQAWHGANMERSDAERLAAEKERHEVALAAAFSRGLDAEERAARERAMEARARTLFRRPNRMAWRDRADFVRVLLAETGMSARDIAATAGVTIYDVFREKLLMRRASRRAPQTS